jgi:iron complex transport system permease protein
MIRHLRPARWMRLDRRVPLLLAVLGLLAFGVALLHIGVGAYAIAPGDVFQTLIGRGPKAYDFIVNQVRLPRALVAYLVGMALALAGGILQGLTRNPLASPEILGVTAGANVVAVAILILLPQVPWAALPPAAFAGALIAALLTYLIAWQKGSHPIRLILVGIGIAALAQAGVSILLTSNALIAKIQEAMLWLAGSVYGTTWQQVGPLSIWMAILVPLTFLLSRPLGALQMGDDLARGLGVRVEWKRGALLFAAAGLAGVAVASAGNVTFVGLMAPHIARRLVGARPAGLLAVAGMTGGLILLSADLIGRTIFDPIEIPCGIITAIVGAPYFLYLLIRRR